MPEQVEKVVIIGSGPAGLTAAIYAARADLQPLVFEGFSAGGLIPGGQLMFTTEIENYPGFPEGLLGPDLMGRFRQQAERFGTRFYTEDVTHVDFSTRPFTVASDDHEAKAHAVIIATGARANWLGLPQEDRLKMGGGVSGCAVCDGALPMFRNQPLAVVGGGDSALEEAMYLAKFASVVYLVHRRDQLRASKVMQDRALANSKIKPVWNSVPTEYLTRQDAGGEDKISGLKVRNVPTGTESVIECAGVFMGIGHTPNTELFQGVLPMDEKGYLVTEANSTKMKIPGVFAAGDVQDHVYRQAVTAAGSGCMAALDAERWLSAEAGV